MKDSFKKLLVSVLAVSLACVNLSLHVFAATNETNVSINSNTLRIENEFIAREFQINDGVVRTSVIENKIAQTQIEPQEGSQDFAISVIKPEVEAEFVPPTQKLDRSGWTASLRNSAGTQFSATHVASLFDGDLNTHPDEYQKSGHPFYVDIDLGSVQTVRSMSINKRPGYKDSRYGTNGTMGGFELYVSDDGVNYIPAGKGEFTQAAYNLHTVGSLYNVGDTVYANFNQEYATRYVRIVQTSVAMGTAQEFTTSEINLFSDEYSGPNWNIYDNRAILSTELTFENAEVKAIENGKQLIVHYAPYTMNNVVWDIDQVFVLENDNQYMHSFVEISVDNKDLAQIDYIDTNSFVLAEDMEGLWSIPPVDSLYSMHIGKYEMSLGQPIYANGFYMGSEFPMAETDIVNNITQMRYYSGKTFTRMEADNLLTTDGKFVSWQNVIGSAAQVDTAVVQTDFFAYIEDIATPTEFRKQYNSWYDNMMNITDESIAKSFLGTESYLSANGIEPLDSYVVDDGYNNYYSKIDDTIYVGPEAGAGSVEPNRTGFWEFNHKFPNELYTSSALVQKLQSTFGLWLGPRGGYNYNNKFGQYLEAMGTAYYSSNSSDICVASTRYIENLKTWFADYQKRFDIDYWKLDGFSRKACTNAEHDHMVGGPNNAYYTSDLWEKWIDLFEYARASRAEEGKGLFINATSYLNLSPWLLQWVNVVYIQNSADTGQLGSGDRHEQKIYYRDQAYYNICKENQHQFPLKNIYNHDPIYGVSDNSSATTATFREFMFANAMRGTAFWELYFSPSIMDADKWMVTADALSWAEENHEILKNAKLFGTSPNKANIYGYSCWTDEEGIISITNPKAEAVEYSIVLNEAIGVTSAIQNLTGIQIEPYATGTLSQTASYGDTLTVSLQPHETKIYQYGKKDNVAPAIVSAKTTSENEITIKFNERIQGGEFTVNGKAVEVKLQADYRTVVLKIDMEVENHVTMKNVMDFNGNTINNECNVTYHKDDMITFVSTANELKDANALNEAYDSLEDICWITDVQQNYEINTDKKLTGTTDFSIVVDVKTTAASTELFNSNDEVVLAIDEEGFVTFKVASQTLSSKDEVITVVEKAHGTINTDEYVPTSTKTTIQGMVNDGTAHSIVAVREANGVLKLYVDGSLSSSLYNEEVKNENLQGGIMTIADDEFSGDLGNIQVLNRAFMYNEVPGKITSESELVYSDRKGWSGSACSEANSEKNGDLGVSAALDGNANTRWHSAYNINGNDNCTEEHWVKFDFNRAETFNTIYYLCRGGSNGDIHAYQFDLYDENGEIFKTITGEFEIGKTENHVTLDQSYTAYSIKLTALSTQNGNNFAAVGEFNVANPDPYVEGEDLETTKATLLALVQDMNEALYTKASFAGLKAVINKVENLTIASSLSVASLEAELEAAIAKLVLLPTTVDNLVAEVVDYKTIQLSWNEIADATSYVVERLSNDEWIVVGETNEPSYLATGVKTGKEYTYRVKAIYEQSESAYSEEVSATPMLSGEVELSIAMNGTTKFDLTWTAVEGATRYIVYRKSADNEWKKILTLGKDARTYTSKDMQPNTYQYQVKAARYDSSERVMTNGSNVVEGIVLTQDVAPTNVKVENVDGTITLTWDKVAAMPYYDIYRSKDGRAYRHLKTTTTTTLTNTGLKVGSTYNYKIKAFALVNGEKVYGAEVETAITIE